MTEKKLQELWKETESSKQSTSFADLSMVVKKVESRIKTRDAREIIVAALLIPFFIFFFFKLDNLTARAGALVMVMYSILVIYKLRNVKKHKKPFDPLLTIKHQMINIRTYLSEERALLDSVFYWYLLPPFIGILLFVIGLDIEKSKAIFYLGLTIILYFFIYRLNKKAVRERFNPLLQKIDTAIQELEEPLES